MSTLSSFSPKVWFITGASSGLGRALAAYALECGHRVVATARKPGALADLLETYPDTCRALALDVSDSERAARVVLEAAQCFDGLVVIVNNAGYGLVGAFEELGKEQIARNFQTNFFGALEIIRAALPFLRASQRGHIVNISAAAVISNYAGFSIYGASKWALEGVSESLAIELKPLGIQVTIVEPGPFRTGFISRSLERADVPMPEYERTSGKFLRLLDSMDGRQPGDPLKAAAAILAAVESETPPLRLILGRYANEKARRKSIDAEKERLQWETVGMPTDF